jgi:F-type H+-transporting ATPase subunit delta
MLAPEVGRKYARALLMAAMDKNLLDKSYEQMQDIKKLLEKDRTLLTFLEAPQVLDEHKAELVKNVFGTRLEPLLVEFLQLLVEKHRAVFLPEIVDEYCRQIEAERGIGRATILTAVRLTDEERRLLIAKLAAKTGLKIVLEEKIDPRVIAGMIVILHNEIIDGSVRHGLNLLHDALSQIRVA